MTIIKIPFPAKQLFPNESAGRHWGATRALKEKAKHDAYTLARAANITRLDPAKHHPLSIVFVVPDGRTRDIDGMHGAIKHALDGIALAAGIDDSRFKPVVLDWEPGGQPGCVLIGVDVSISVGMDLP
jgi:crossover junction endodeoxyribonuclease RusA